jgi:hypothetical protein
VEPEETKVDVYDTTVSDIPFKNHIDALASMVAFQPNYHAADLSYDQLKDQEWLQDNQVICDRLHLLREVYKAIQSYKKKSTTPVPVGTIVKSKLENEITIPHPRHELADNKGMESKGETNSPEKFNSGPNDTNGESDDVDNDSNAESNFGYMAKQTPVTNSVNGPVQNSTLGGIVTSNNLPLSSNYPYNAPPISSFQPQPIPNQMHIPQYANYNPGAESGQQAYHVPVQNFMPTNGDHQYHSSVPTEGDQAGNTESKPNIDGVNAQPELDLNGPKYYQSDNTFMENDMSFASLNKSIDRAIEELDNTKAMSNTEYSTEGGQNIPNTQPEPWYGDRSPANYDMSVLNALNQPQSSDQS